MASRRIDIKKSQPMQQVPADMWGSLRGEMDRLFDRFSSGWGLPSLGAPFGSELAPRDESSVPIRLTQTPTRGSIFMSRV